MSKKTTATDIRRAMSAQWRAPEWAIMWEVANATGYAQRRFADAVMMSLWPSRGLELHGVEIKVSRSDWKREKDNPRKAEEIAQFCDRWWIYSASGVIRDLSELPMAWGLREWDGIKWTTRREAARTEAQPVTREFLAALLRRSDETFRTMISEVDERARVAAQEALSAERDGIAARVENEVERRRQYAETQLKRYQAFEETFGPITKAPVMSAGELGAAARALVEVGTRWVPLAEHARRLRTAAEAIEALRDVIKLNEADLI